MCKGNSIDKHLRLSVELHSTHMHSPQGIVPWQTGRVARVPCDVTQWWQLIEVREHEIGSDGGPSGQFTRRRLR